MTRRVATICARGGSKGVPGKNLRLLAGKPLLVWTLEAALNSGLFDLVVVDSDHPDLLALGSEHGADLCVERPAALAGDATGKLPAIAHAVQAAEQHAGHPFDVVVDLDVTSPLRLQSDILGAVELLEQGGAGNVITGAESRRSPYFNLVEADPSGAVAPSKPATRYLRRQDTPPCFDMNASIYVWWRDRFVAEPYVFDEGTRLYEMPTARSFDIDEPFDFKLVEWLMLERENGVEE